VYKVLAADVPFSFLRATYFFIAAELILKQVNALQLLAGMILSKQSTFSQSSEHN